MGRKRREPPPLSADQQAAFEKLTDRWWLFVYKRALRTLHDPNSAADLTQSTFLHAARKYSQLRQIEHPSGWLLRILFSLHRDARQRRRAIPSGFASDPPAEHDPRVDHAEESDDLLERLKPPATTDAEYAYLQSAIKHGFDPKAVATELNITENYARRLQQLVKARLDSLHIFEGGEEAFLESFHHVAKAFSVVAYQCVDGLGRPIFAGRKRAINTLIGHYRIYRRPEYTRGDLSSLTSASDTPSPASSSPPFSPAERWKHGSKKPPASS